MSNITENFGSWMNWQERNSLPHLRCPGVYAIAYSEKTLSGLTFSETREIVYFGVASDLRKRLKQFDDTISKKRTSHGGALRMLDKHRVYEELIPKLYVAVSAIGTYPMGHTADCLRRKGDALQLECYCIASYFDNYSALPLFNDRNSLKFDRRPA